MTTTSVGSADASAAAPAVPTPALRVKDLVIRATVQDEAPATPHAPRDLPDLARFLFHALASDVEQKQKVLTNVSFDVEPGRCLAIVGEDGSGKSTLARACARLVRPESGTIEVLGKDIHRARGKALAEVRRALHVLFDDPEDALDPRRTVRESLTLADEALRLDPSSRDARVTRALERARLARTFLDTRAADLAPGPRKLAALARALLGEPAIIVVDEPASGLDPSDRALVLETLSAVRGAVSGSAQEPGCALLVLTRDLAAARALAQRAGVLRKGKLVEVDAVERVLERPTHPYAQALVAAAPRVRVGT